MNKQALVVLAALFVLMSSAAAARAEDREIVKVNGTPILQSEVFDRLWKRFGPDTLDEMVDELLLRQAVARAKIAVSPAEVDKRFAKVRAQFSDPKIFEAELTSAGSSVEKLKTDLREQLEREKLLSTEKKLAISEDELKKAFAAHKSELGRPEAIHLRHILVGRQDEADKIVADVKAGKDFVAIAREKSLAPTGKVNGGDYGFVSKGMLPPEIEQIAFSMKADDLRVLPSAKGFHVLQALERRPAAPAEYAKVKDDLRELMLQDKIKAAMPDYLRELRAKAEIKTATN
jgi:foldase protein PrsA